MPSEQSRHHRHHIRRLIGYVLSQKRLLLLSLMAGAVGYMLMFAYPWIIGHLIDDVIAPRPDRGATLSQAARMHELLLLTIMAAATAVFFAVSGFFKGHLTLKLGDRIVMHIRRDLFEHLHRLSLHFYAKERTGGLAWRLIHDVRGVNGVIYNGVILAGLDVLQLGVALWLLTCISWRLTIAVTVILPLYVLTFKLLNPYIRQTTDKVGRHLGQLSSNVNEQISAMALVKSYAAEQREVEKFMADNEEHYGYIVQQSRVGHLVGAIAEGLIHLGTTIIIGYGGYLALTRANPITAGDIMKFLGYVGILYGPVKRFADLNKVYQESLASIRRVFRVFDITPKIGEHEESVKVAPHIGRVRFESVRFHYHPDCDETRIRLDEDEPDDSPFKIRADGTCRAPKWVLDGVTFEIERGQRVALVGPSGSGKTTLGSLLPRLYDVTEGRILIDDVDIRDYSLKALRQGVAVVQQESFLFSGTIRDNIVYGKPEASESEVIAAAQAANAHDFIMQMSDGYNTRLGERGVNLSGGQRQRLSIARALLKDPRILILDEATSALDAESEVLVQQALNRLMRGRTCLIIAHRLSTVRNADRIVVLQHGKVVEQGRHDELMVHNGLYARLVRHQFETHDVHPAEPVPAGAVIHPGTAGRQKKSEELTPDRPRRRKRRRAQPLPV